ncbi:glycoside hydrolase [Solitalea sp. MAHUQ-68]|uniref:Glycoside hydrolase n=1 Tax=Solitalea agri TaxID=2953739 RepID=A0A9X2JCJ1_9SPHI|nr:sialidase family protein [Solitalea agri]MCO4293123.1 glycoside hydrolase [Solitalea agri]
MKINRVLAVLFCSFIFSSCNQTDNEEVKIQEEENLFTEREYIKDSNIKLLGFNTDTLPVAKRVLLANSPAFKGYAYASVHLFENKLMMVATRFVSPSDWSGGEIILLESSDEGKTWSKERVIQENIGLVQTCAPSLISTNKTLMLFFLVKNSSTDCHVYFKKSSDNGKTWTEPTKISSVDGYNIINNDRCIVVKNRIIVPVAFAPEIHRFYQKQGIFCYYSDDNGKSWKRSSSIATTIPLMEPGIVHVGGSELLMVIRSNKGKVMFSRSFDLGVTWTIPVSSNLSSPEAPATIARLPKSNTLLLVWNNNPAVGLSKRNPLTIAFSKDKGTTWTKPFMIEYLKNSDFCYTSVCFDSKKCHVTYTQIPYSSTFKQNVKYFSIDIKTVNELTSENFLKIEPPIKSRIPSAGDLSQN